MRGREARPNEVDQKMTTETLYHVTDESNIESIMDEGLLPNPNDSNRFVFLTSTKDGAERVGETYDTIEDPVVVEVEVMSHKVEEDPEPHGDLDSYAHRGQIPPHDVEVVHEDV